MSIPNQTSELTASVFHSMLSKGKRYYQLVVQSIQSFGEVQHEAHQTANGTKRKASDAIVELAPPAKRGPFTARVKADSPAPTQSGRTRAAKRS